MRVVCRELKSTIDLVARRQKIKRWKNKSLFASQKPKRSYHSNDAANQTRNLLGKAQRDWAAGPLLDPSATQARRDSMSLVKLV